MIGLVKLAEPASLQRNKVRWTQELLEAIQTGVEEDISAKKKKYNRPDVKKQLRRETKEKCAYCESRVTVVSHGDIEHVTPKSIEPEMTFEWDNLTFACQKCNGKKSNKEDIIDPYNEPLNQLTFFAAPFLRGTNAKARRTILELGLNRQELIDDRLDGLKEYSSTLERISNEQDERLKELLYRELLDDLETGKPEYISMKRAILSNYLNF